MAAAQVEPLSPVITSPAMTARPDRAKRRKDLLLDDEVLMTSNMEGRTYSACSVYTYWFFCVITCGLVWLCFQWCKKALQRLISRPAPPEQADFFIVDGVDGTHEICHVERVAVEPLEMIRARKCCSCSCFAIPRSGSVPLSQRMVVYRHSRFMWSEAARSYALLVPEDFSPAAVPAAGLSSTDAASRLSRSGANVIDIPIEAGPVLFFRECIHFFSIFQLWAVIESYYSYSAFIFATALGTAFVNYADVRANLFQIRKLAKFTTRVTVIRDGARRTVSSADLVPGDSIVVQRGMTMPCDVVLTHGVATATESMLTGETTVVTKTPSAPSAVHTAEARNTLFGGTHVAEIRVGRGDDVLGTVVRTGWESVKGRLVLSILYPRPMPFKFVRESILFVVLLFLAAMIGFGINAWQMRLACVEDDGVTQRACTSEEIQSIVQRGCDMVTIVVPPALPLALTVGVIYATSALRKRSLYCISPQKINVAGKINAICFDKTGTLTTDSLQLATVHPATGGVFGAPVARSAMPAGGDSSEDAKVVGVISIAADGAVTLPTTPGPATEVPTGSGELPLDMRALLACCHSLTHVNGALAGDPLEVQTFAATGAAIEEPQTSPDVAALLASTPSLTARVTMSVSGSAGVASTAAPWSGNVVGVFEFVPALQRMGVLVEVAASSPAAGPTAITQPGRTISYVKGSPEAIASLCDPATIPTSFHATLASYTRTGLRVLAAACKVYPAGGRLPLPGTDFSDIRAEAERGLTFLGLIVLANPLKPQSIPTIAKLRSEASMHMAMVTGDHVQAAVCIARDCGLVESGHRVYMGDLSTEGGSQSVVWRPFDAVTDGDAGFGSSASSSVIHPHTLQPLDGYSGPFKFALTGRAFALLLSQHIAAKTRVASASGRRLGLGVGGAAGGAGAAAIGITPAAAIASMQPDSDPTYLPRIALNCAVFARMSPDAKAQLVELLQGTGLYVAMVGDGANDSLALRAAHVGVSLTTTTAPGNGATAASGVPNYNTSEGTALAQDGTTAEEPVSQGEASVAAPFTYAVPNPGIEAIHLLLCEGRGALTTSYNMFLFMALYSTIQFANALLIVFATSFLSNNMYLYQDLLTVFVLALTLGNTPASTSLTVKRPSGRLFSAQNLLLTFGFIALTFGLQAHVFLQVRKESWYDDVDHPAAMQSDDPDAWTYDSEGTNSAIPETTTVFLMSCLQYIAVATIFSIGFPYKQGTHKNPVFLVWLLFIVVCAILLFFKVESWVYWLLSMQEMPTEWNNRLFGWSVLSFILYFAWWGALIAGRYLGVFRFFSHACCGRRVAQHKAIRTSWQAQFKRSAAAGKGVGDSSPIATKISAATPRAERDGYVATDAAVAVSTPVSDAVPLTGKKA